MNETWTWVAAVTTVSMLVLYEVLLLWLQQHHPERFARSVHASLREEWFQAVSVTPGSEILAVQTLRNSLMSATMLASTAVLGLMGTVTLTAPSLYASFAQFHTVTQVMTPRLLLELVLLGLLFTSLVSTVMSVRFYSHASFIGALPVGSQARLRWSDSGVAYVRKAGLLYSVGLRHLLLVMPVVAALLAPVAGPPAAVVVAVALYSFDHV